MATLLQTPRDLWEDFELYKGDVRVCTLNGLILAHFVHWVGHNIEWGRQLYNNIDMLRMPWCGILAGANQTSQYSHLYNSSQ
jgi:hypothetical protein